MRIAARVAQDQLVELAGFELELLRREFMFARRAQSTVTSIGVCRDRSPAASAAPETTPNTTAEPNGKRKKAMFVPL